MASGAALRMVRRYADHLLNALAGAFFDGATAAEAIGERVEASVGGLIANEERGLAVPGAGATEAALQSGVRG